MELNELHTEHEHASINLKVILLIFALVLIGTLSYLIYNDRATPTDEGGDTILNPKKTTQTTDEKKTAATPTPTALACGDTTKYGFSMTFGNLWTGMKIKEVLQKDMAPQPGYALVTCYFNVPTSSTEAVWTSQSTTNFAKYASVFAVSVYTPAQWEIAKTEPNADTQLKATSDYVWGYGSAQSLPQDLQDAKIAADVKTVVATFQTTN